MMGTETETFGASMSAGCVRGVVLDGSGRIVDVRYADAADSTADSAIAALEMSAELGLGHDAPVLAVSGDPQEMYGPGGVRLIGECDAYLAAARVEGCVDHARILAIVDLGSVGTRVHLLDASTGEQFSCTRTDQLSGHAVDDAIADHLAVTFGATEKMSDAAMSNLARDSTAAKEMLSDERAVDLSGPFVTESVRLRRTDVEVLIESMVADVADMVADAVASGAEAV
ncbi:MAG: Hsp70 family protein, partial [Rhodococcus sp. (in: high G+C Gram-positive bacteria)]